MSLPNDDEGRRFAAGGAIKPNWQPCPDGRHVFDPEPEHLIKIDSGVPYLGPTHVFLCINQQCNWIQSEPCGHDEIERARILGEAFGRGGC